MNEALARSRRVFCVAAAAVAPGWLNAACGSGGGPADTTSRGHPLANDPPQNVAPDSALFFASSDVPSLRSKCDASPCKEWLASYRRNAIAGQSYSGDDEGVRSFGASAMAFVDLLDGARTYHATVVSWLSRAGKSDTDFEPKTGGFGWNTGGWLADYAMAYDWIRPSLSEAENDAVRAALGAYVDKVYDVFLRPPRSSSNYAYFINVRMRVAGGLGLCCLVLGRDATLDALQQDLFGTSPPAGVSRYLDSVVSRDGLYKEGVAYQSDSFSVLLPFLLALRRRSGKDFTAGAQAPSSAPYDDRVRRMYAANLDLMMPDGGTPTLATGYRMAFPHQDWAALVCPAPEENLWLWERSAGMSSDHYALSIVAYSAAAFATRRAPTHGSVIRDNFSVFRSGWNADDTWMLLLHGSEPSRSTHDQPHQTSFAFYARGQYLVIDPGDGRAYDKADHYWLRYSPAAHNLVTIDGAEGIDNETQTPTKTWRYADEADPVWDPARVVDGCTDSAIDLVEVGIDRYRDIPDVSSRRTVAFPDRDYLVVIDELQASAVHRYDQLLHLGGADNGSDLAGTLNSAGEGWSWTTTNAEGKPLELRALYAGTVALSSQSGRPTDWSGKAADRRGHTLVRAQVTAADAIIAVALLPRLASEPSATLTRVAGDGACCLKVTSPAWTDRNVVRLQTGSTQVDADGVAVSGLYGHVREMAGAATVVAMKRGSKLTWKAQDCLRSDVPVTVVSRVAPDQSLRGSVSLPTGAARVWLRLPPGRVATGATCAGVAVAFAAEGSGVVLTLSAQGAFAVTTAPA